MQGWKIACVRVLTLKGNKLFACSKHNNIITFWSSIQNQSMTTCNNGKNPMIVDLVPQPY
jgi:hypothetical protein